MLWHKKKNSYQNSFFYIVIGLLMILLVIRMILPTFIKNYVNGKLSDENQRISIHVKDVDLRVLRGYYALRGVTGILKDSGGELFNAEVIAMRIPWRDLLKGRILADLYIDKMNVQLSKKSLAKLKEIKGNKGQSKFEPRSLKVKNSQLVLRDFLGPKDSITDINILITNLSPTTKSPTTSLHGTGKVFGISPLSMAGTAELKLKKFDLTGDLKNFDLYSLRALIKEKANIEIKGGRLDLYVKAGTKKGIIKGYLKPFIKNLSIASMPQKLNFENESSFLITTLLKDVLSNSEHNTIATVVPFSYKNKFEFQIVPALKKAVEYKLKKNISPDEKQSQEER